MTQPRRHIVLVPGFAGFDALGQIAYYAGTTAAYQGWRETSELDSASRVTLHYFDNEPSASVASRAKRLRAYLAKLIARNEIQSSDAIALVGHSTGGLDIRRMVADLAMAPDEVLSVDSVTRGHAGVDSAQLYNHHLLALIQRVVFLSTPHCGTNLADFIDRFPRTSRLALRAVKLGMAITRLTPATLSQRVLDWVGSDLKGFRWDLDALLALLDAYREADEGAFARTSGEAADAREAHAQFELWIDHMIADFQVVKDLKTQHEAKTTRLRPETPWPPTIATRSYATIGGDPTAHSRPPMDMLYRVLHKVGRSGPLRAATPSGTRWFEQPFRTQRLTHESNDGIVNTLSMFFDRGGDTYLVAADHGDVIGHYRRVRALESDSAAPSPRVETRPGRRRFASYDFFKSGSGFTEESFYRLWDEIFDFCARSADASIGESLPNAAQAAPPSMANMSDDVRRVS
jgi:triacylglycerol lipase